MAYDTTESFERGARLYHRLAPESTRTPADGLADIAPTLGRAVVEHGLGDIMARTGLDLRTREIATVCMLTASVAPGSRTVSSWSSRSGVD